MMESLAAWGRQPLPAFWLMVLALASALFFGAWIALPHRHAHHSYRSGYRMAAAVQCDGWTVEGRPCRNRTTDPSGRCYLHRGQRSFTVAALVR